jgi:hypothetical protein
MASASSCTQAIILWMHSVLQTHSCNNMYPMHANFVHSISHIYTHVFFLFLKSFQHHIGDLVLNVSHHLISNAISPIIVNTTLCHQ